MTVMLSFVVYNDLNKNKNRKYNKMACEKMEGQTKMFYFNLWKT
jgi:hypothetical protein